MKSDKAWRNTILPHLEKAYPVGIIMMLQECCHEEEEIIDAAFYHIGTPEEVKLFFIEYGFYCHLRDPENDNSEESMAMKDIIEYMMTRIERILPLWFNALNDEIEKILAQN